MTYHKKILKQNLRLLSYLITIVCRFTAGTFLTGSLLTTSVTVLMILEPSLTIKCSIDILGCSLTLSVILQRISMSLKINYLMELEVTLQ